MDNFNEALKHTLQFEGGYVNDPADNGGETFRGVSRKSWPKWPGWVLIDKAKAEGERTAKAINARFVDDKTMGEIVAKFYNDNFWKPFECLCATGRINGKLFDTAVNVGVKQAFKFLQSALNDRGATLTVDGIVGAKTIAAVQDALIYRPVEEGAVLALLVQKQSDFYKRLAANKPSQQKFLKGWLRRAEWLP